jgi:hypothetical protein
MNHANISGRFRFGAGKIFCSPAAFEACRQAGMHPARLVLRHLSGDWGQVSDKRRRINRWLAQGHRRLRAPPIICRYQLGRRNLLVVTRYLGASPIRRQTLVVLSAEFFAVPAKKKRHPHKGGNQLYKNNQVVN